MNFLNPYSRIDYKDFFQNKLLTDEFEFIEEKLSLEFKPQYLMQAEILGRDKSLELDVYEILHESENDPRVGLSKDIFRLMSKYGSKRALAILYSPNSKNYRLSLATVELSLEGSRIKREYSNPRRYSFFLGPDSKIHTPSEFLINKGRVSDFEDLQNRFSIEVVNKEFYQRIAVQFSRLIGGQRKVGSHTEDFRRTLSMPSVTEQHIFQEFAVRLIGRLVFCWFLKMKKSENNIPLITSEVLSVSTAKSRSNYYHNVLEKLFFEVLNTPIDNRSEEFKLKPYISVPFLNGGLFSPHKEDYYETDKAGISKHLNTLKVPDKWIQDFLEILETYNFTVDENTSVDVDLSVDPEMLGRIFENLLAEINPDTGESARKATGSYYTPRTIVEHMVDESLKQYLVVETSIEENKITDLLSYGDGEVCLDDKEKEDIVNAFDKAKILDPACGSGAFPIGILQKMLLVLKRVDPHSQLWLSKQLNRVPTSALRDELKKKLENENVEYIHKLGIIQNSIYGVDIQPIATEISKLRCFLSLIVDEKVFDDKVNRGILPLPNLEFKFVAANTLIPLPKSSSQSELFNVDEEITKLEGIRKQYFTASGKQKEIIEEGFLKTQKELVSNYFKKQAKDNRAVKLANWNPFSDEASEWFDSEWMFGLNQSFHIIIGNPPYGIIFDDNLKNLYENNYPAFKRNNDIYVAFYQRAFSLLSNKGFLIYISANTFLNGDYFKNLRKYLTSVSTIIEIVDFKNIEIFENATVFVCVFFTKKVKTIQPYIATLKTAKDSIYKLKFEKLTIKFDSDTEFKAKDSIINKLESNNKIKMMDDLFFVKDVGFNYWSIGRKKTRGQNSIGNRILYTGPKINKKDIPYLKGRNIFKYHISKSSNYLRHNYNDYLEENDIFRFSENFLKINPKIVYRQTSDSIIAAIDKGSRYTDKTVHLIVPKYDKLNIEPTYILALLNSKLFNHIYNYLSQEEKGRAFSQVKTTYIKKLPILSASIQDQSKLSTLINKIENVLEENENAKINHLEDKIDIIIYKLYNLTFEEVKIIDPEIEKIISEKDYEKMEI